MRRLAILLAVMALIGAACDGSAETSTTSPAPPQTTESPPPPSTDAATSTTMVTTSTAPPDDPGVIAAPSRLRTVEPFAEFAPIPLLEAGSYPGPETPANLDDVLVAAALRFDLEDPAVAAALAANGFVIVPGFSRLFHDNYEPVIYDPYPVFVTTDAAYHVWHLAFSKVLRDLEETTLLPLLEDFVAGLLDDARAQATELEGTPLAEHAERVAEWFQAAGALLEMEVGALSERAAAEVELAMDAAEMTASPVTSFNGCDITVSAAGCVDYTQFRPRGHYTRSEALQRYFRTMSMLGQTGFFLDQPDSLRMGLLVARLLDADPGLTATWELIYEPTAFLVGLADDFTPFELAAAAGDVTPDGVVAPVEFADPAVVVELADRLLATRAVQINPEGASVRVMGARFVVDSFILDQLTWPDVGGPEIEDRRVEPSPLDVAASFGSAFAYAVQEAAGETEYRNYDTQLAAMRSLVAERTIADWAGTVYDAWLYALEPMWATHGEAYPDFMRTEAWTAKAHQTGFGSYAELKHDTVLYGKQGFAAEAGGTPPAFTPRHWVEPDPVAFRRIGAVARLTQSGLAERGLLPADLDDLLDDVQEFTGTLARLADDELAGRPISEGDNQWLESVGAQLELLWLASADIDEDTGLPSTDDEDAAIIADIFRSSFAFLEIGTGRIDSIYVLVPNDEGRFQVARGGVYSYYEFWRPASEGRLTDEEWREALDAESVPDRPVWQAGFLPGAAGGGDVALPAPTGTLDYAEPGLFCRDLADRGLSFDDAVRYWWWDGSPARMDADSNGVPCETVYPASVVDAFWADREPSATEYRGTSAGAFCRDLDAAGFDYLAAFEYWLWDGRPERMDADRNGVPCETVYEGGEVAGVLFEVGYSVG